MFLPVAALLSATVAAYVLLDDVGKLPYFPIELSRLMATGPASRATFAVGAALCGALFGRTWWHYAMCAAAFGIAVFDDVHFWGVHMGCVTVLLTVAAASCWQQPEKLTVVTAAFALYGCRIVFKWSALAANEGIPFLDVARLVSYGLEVMATGVARSPHTLTVFRLGGVLQWLCFLLLASVV